MSDRRLRSQPSTANPRPCAPGTAGRSAACVALCLGLGLGLGATAASAAAPDAPLFQCNTRKHQIVIDGDPATERFRYRAWNRPKPMTAPPDMAVASGTQDYEGTGPCRYHFYRFKTGNVEYIVADSLGCTESWPPKDAVGELTVLIGGEVKSSQWCRR
jgi:hypothetical protein